MLVEKILFWLDAGFTQFGIAKFLQNIVDGEFFAIIDTNEGKEFFKNQKFVDFRKIWFYRDCLTLNKKIDKKLLIDFEKKYNLNLWKIIYSDVHFNKYNKFYKFKLEEILPIIEQEIKFYEQILNEIKPNFLIIRTTDYSKNQILHQICKAKKIPILSLGHTRLGTKCIITTENDIVDDYQKILSLEKNKEYSWEELQSNLKIYSKSQKDMVKTYQSSFLDKILAAWYFTTHVINEEYRKYYEHQGWSIGNLIKNEFSAFFQRRIRKRFIEKNSTKELTFNEKYVYFPLQFEPERSVLIVSPFYANQLEVLKNIAKSLPIDYFLYVKEHPSQSLNNWREIEYYKQILKISNVKFIHSSIPSLTLVKNSDLVVTVTGTAGLEAAFFQKPSIVFGDSIYSELSCVHRVKNLEELPKIIRISLKKKVDLSELNNFMNMIENNSFEFDITKMQLEIDNMFHFDAFLQDVKIDNKKMSTFLEKNKNVFSDLADEHLKKIMIYKNLK
jgi:hypothetical protein